MSNEYLLEYTRIKLRAALRDLSGGSKGQLEALCEHPPADKNAYPRKHIHRVQLEDRTVDALVTPVYALEAGVCFADSIPPEFQQTSPRAADE
ncbi:hypothetical protein EIMP300_45680 [Escherichia coli]|uniref:Uncharacterized protein n=1 Tax=Escherichia coli TaxID=562 RepID=A0A8S0FT03_ECOLX|nr:hypothetical protein EIMP300_45680 [Escherichia coli]